MNVCTKSIENLNKLLLKHDVIYSVYPYDGYTVNAVLCQLYAHFKEISDSQKELIENMLIIVEWVKGEGLQKYVVDEISKMADDGRLSDIINNEIFSDIMDRLKRNEYDISEEIKNRIKGDEKVISDVNEIIDKTMQELNKAIDGFNKLYDKNTLVTAYGDISLKNQMLYNVYNVPRTQGVNNVYGQYPVKAGLTIDGSLIFEGVLTIDAQPEADQNGGYKLVDLNGYLKLKGIIGFPLYGSVVVVDRADTNNSTIMHVYLNSDCVLCIRATDWRNIGRIRMESISIKIPNVSIGNVYTSVEEGVINAIPRKQNRCIQGVWFSDIHVDYRDPRKFTNLEMINVADKMLYSNFILNTGDSIQDTRRVYEGQNKAQALACHRYTHSSFNPNKYLMTWGNHDSNVLPDYNPNYMVSQEDVCQMLNNHNFVQGKPNSIYGFIDYDNLRIILVDSHENYKTGAPYVSDEQIQWFKDVALKTNSHVLICSHVTPYNHFAQGSEVANGTGLRNAIKDFKDKGGNVIAWIGGHEHKDYAFKYDGVQIIWILNCLTEKTTTQRFEGSSSKTAFDIITIDTSMRELHLDRCGAISPGFDRYRKFTY